MNSIRRIRRSAAVLAGALLASITSAPAALASLPPEPAGPAVPLVRAHTVVTGGMPGWQITLIAAGAALTAAALALFLDRARAARRRATARTA